VKRKNTRRKSGLGFALDEEMVGYHEFVAGEGEPGRRPFIFRVNWGHESLLNVVGKLGLSTECYLKGTVTADGLCEESPCEGRLLLDYRGTHTIRYEFTFESHGQPLRYTGEKVNIRPWNLPVSHTTCFGTITRERDGALISRGVAFFKLSKLPSFLASFRLHRAA
jgi:hypothetical protein